MLLDFPDHQLLFGLRVPRITLGLQLELLAARFAAQEPTQLLLDHPAALALSVLLEITDQLEQLLLEARLAHLVQQVPTAPLLAVQNAFCVMLAHTLPHLAQPHALALLAPWAILDLSGKRQADQRPVLHALQEHMAAATLACLVLQELPQPH